MAQSLDYLKETASQTAGPYVHIGLSPGAAGFSIYKQELGQTIATSDVPGTRIHVSGIVLDGTGAPVKDVLIEVWQADATGIYPHSEDPNHSQAHPGFRGWGRVIPDFDSGEFAFETIKPGPTIDYNGRKVAPHLNLWLVARGINIGLNTRMYFPDEDNSTDPVLSLIEHSDRRATLIATASPKGYHFHIRLQGDNETVFFDV